MKTLERAIFKELLLTFLVCFLAVDVVLVAEKTIRLTKELSAIGISATDMLKVALYLQPMFGLLTMPMSLLVAVLLTYGRLQADSEVTAMRSIGMSFPQIARPVFYLGTMCFIAGLTASFYLAPMGAMKLRSTLSEALTARAPQAVEPGVFTTALKGLVMQARDKAPDGSLIDVFISDERARQQPVALFAHKGSIKNTGLDTLQLILEDGHMYVLGDDVVTDVGFERYSLQVPLALSVPAKKTDELGPFELYQFALGAHGAERLGYQLEFSRKLTFPALCLALMFLGPALAMKAGRAARLNGLALGLGVFGAYYPSLLYCESMVRSGALPVTLGPALPIVVVAGLAAWLFAKEAGR